MTPKEARSLVEWGSRMWSDPNKHIDAETFEKWKDWASTYYVDDHEMLDKVMDQANTFMVNQTKRREQEFKNGTGQIPQGNNQPAGGSSSTHVVQTPQGDNQPAGRSSSTPVVQTPQGDNYRPINGSGPVMVGNQSGTSTSEQSGSSRSESQMQLTPEAQQAEREARDAYMQSHGYVKAPDGTWKLNQTLFDALNIPREDLRKERERQQKENRMKQLVSGLYHGGALLSDMISAGVGGNVWKREKDDTAEKAAAENKQLRTLQLAEDAAFAEKQRKDMQDTLDKAQQQADQRRRELMKTVSTQTHQSKGEQKSESSSTQQSVQNSTSVGTQTSVQGTTYSDALKGGGLVGRSRRRYGYGSGSGSSKNPDYIPVRLVNTANGQEYMTFEVDKAEKEALAGAVAASIQEAAANGDANARRLLSLYFTPGSRGKRGSKPTPDQWNYDGLINDASLYQVPGVLNRYLDELENLGVTYTDPKTNQEKAYSREQLYEMITGDVATKRVNAKGQEEWYYPKLPQGVTLSPKGRTIKSPWLNR